MGFKLYSRNVLNLISNTMTASASRLQTWHKQKSRLNLADNWRLPRITYINRQITITKHFWAESNANLSICTLKYLRYFYTFWVYNFGFALFSRTTGPFDYLCTKNLLYRWIGREKRTLNKSWGLGYKFLQLILDSRVDRLLFERFSVKEEKTRRKKVVVNGTLIVKS